MTNRAKGALLASVFLVAGVPALVGTSPAKAATVITSSAYGVGADLNVLQIVSASLGPLGAASGTAPSSYNVTKTVAAATNNLNLGVDGLVGTTDTISPGVITSTARSPYTPTETGTATTTIDRLSSDLHTDVLGRQLLDILGISANTITSTSSVSGLGALPTASGSSTIEGLTFSGSVFNGVTLDAAALAAAAPNTVLFDLGGLEIVLNQQIRTGDGVTSAGIETNALAVDFSNFLLGGDLLNGDVIIGHSQAGITGFAAPVGGVPEPAIWAELIAGFGLTGAALRRRRGELAAA